MDQPTRFIGLDVHKDTIVVARTAAGEVGKALPGGTFPNTGAALEKPVGRLRQAGSGPIKFCYEARPCGHGVHRTLTRLGEECMVVAPPMIPRKSGERQKTDKRDAASLAVLHRGGLLTAVWVPDAAHEAVRDLIRARQAAVRAVRAARQQLSAFLLRHERVYASHRTPWTKRRTGAGWLAARSYRFPARIARTKLAAVEALRAIAWKARTRLCRRYRRMVAAGKPNHIVVAAIARELAGFVWSIACITPDPPAAAIAEPAVPARPSVAPCPPPSSTLRAGSAGGLRPCLTAAARDAAKAAGRDEETGRHSRTKKQPARPAVGTERTGERRGTR